MAVTTALRPPREQVDPRCRAWWALQFAGLFGVPAVALVVISVVFGVDSAWLWTVVGVLVGVGVLSTAVGPAVLFRSHRWEVTDEAVFARRGLLWQEWRAAPLSRVQTVDVTRGPVQRVFGLATVTVTTASAKGPVRIEALDHRVAEELAASLTALTEQTARAGDSGDAT